MNIYNEKNNSMINVNSIEIDTFTHDFKIAYRKTDFIGNENSPLFKQILSLEMLNEMGLINLTGIAELLLKNNEL